MAYIPPGVEITQTQKTVSPTLIEPDLIASVIGPAFKVNNIAAGYDSPYASFDGNQTVITLSGLDASMSLDQTNIYVDLVMPPSAATDTVPAESRLIIASGLATSSTSVTIPANATWIGAKIMVGWRALRGDLSSATLFSSVQEIVEEMDDVSSLNPLGFALMQSLNNGNSAAYGYGILNDEYTNLTISGTTATNHALALDEFSTKEVYSLAPLTVDEAVLATYKTHVENYSTPEEKRERIVFGTPQIPWDNSAIPSSNKGNTALAMSTKSGAVGSKRVFYIFPDTAFVQEVRHVSSLLPDYVSNIYLNGFSTTVRAYLTQKVTFSATNAEVAYRGYTVNPVPGVGVEITQSLWNALYNHATETRNPFFLAYVPIPGSVALSTAVAGQVAGNSPQQGLTNLTVAGVNSLKFSSDWFAESYLNTIAQGGTYILKQSKPTTSIICRHQLSTDMSSVEKRELSITKTVDYVAKFVRNAVSPFVGKYIINPLTLNLLKATIAGSGEVLKRDGVLNGFEILSLTQDTVQKDTVLVSISILPPYPVNYIKIDLIF